MGRRDPTDPGHLHRRCSGVDPRARDHTAAGGVNNRLLELRAARRWSQADLADRLDVSRQTVNSIETGRYDPSLPLAFRIAAVFGEPIESLFSPVMVA